MSFLKPPSPDEVFSIWVSGMRDDEVEELFARKDMPFDRSSVSAAEFVKEVDRKIAVFFMSKVETESLESEKKESNYEGLLKVKFYEFPKGKVSPELKLDSRLPMFNSLEKVECSECAGKGYLECDKCGGKGTLPCSECGESGEVSCDECDGSKEITLTLSVISNGEEVEKELKIQCPTCFGSGKVVCGKCGGLTKLVCNECEGDGKFPCKKCKGAGIVFSYSISPPPVSGKKAYLIYSKPEIDEALSEMLVDKISQLEAVKVNDYKQLNKDDLEALLGFYNKDVDSKASRARKLFAELEKKADKTGETPLYPIYIFPIVRLDVETVKGKRIQVFAVGGEKNYTTITLR
ncbi:MAG: hypothetical protein QXP17_02885 [Candidatus Jordarchaeales archaeon]